MLVALHQSQQKRNLKDLLTQSASLGKTGQKVLQGANVNRASIRSVHPDKGHRQECCQAVLEFPIQHDYNEQLFPCKDEESGQKGWWPYLKAAPYYPDEIHFIVP